MIAKLRLPPPSQWEDFEILVWRIFKDEWKDSEVERFGRQGQQQYGLDILGRDYTRNKENVAIQCKNYKKKATRQFLEDCINKVKSFEKPIDKFILALSTERDAKLQLAAIELNERNLKEGLFGFKLLFWDDLIDYMYTKHQAILGRYIAPFVSNQKVFSLNHLFEDKIESAKNIIGRKKIKAEIKTIISDKTSATILLHGEPGIGKTTLFGNLSIELKSHKKVDRIITYFFSRDTVFSDTSNFKTYLFNSLFECYDISVDNNGDLDVISAFEKVNDILESRKKSLVLIIDGLDEAKQPKEVLKYISTGFSNIVFMLSTRQNEYFENALVDQMNFTKIGLDSSLKENVSNAVEYVNSLIPAWPKEIVNNLVIRAEANFLYLKLLCEYLIKIKAGASEAIKIAEDFGLSRGDKLHHFYSKYWSILNEQDSLSYKVVADIHKVLGVLCVVQESISKRQIFNFLGRDWSVLRFERVNDHISQFVKIDQEPFGLAENAEKYRIFHASFKDFIYSKLEPVLPAVHKQITQYYFKDNKLATGSLDNYGYQYLSFHAYLSDQQSLLYDLLEGPFIGRKTKWFGSNTILLKDINLALENASEKNEFDYLVKFQAIKDWIAKPAKKELYGLEILIKSMTLDFNENEIDLNLIKNANEKALILLSSVIKYWVIDNTSALSNLELLIDLCSKESGDSVDDDMIEYMALELGKKVSPYKAIELAKCIKGSMYEHDTDRYRSPSYERTFFKLFEVDESFNTQPADYIQEIANSNLRSYAYSAHGCGLLKTDPKSAFINFKNAVDLIEGKNQRVLEGQLMEYTFASLLKADVDATISVLEPFMDSPCFLGIIPQFIYLLDVQIENSPHEWIDRYNLISQQKLKILTEWRLHALGYLDEFKVSKAEVEFLQPWISGIGLSQKILSNPQNLYTYSSNIQSDYAYIQCNAELLKELNNRNLSDQCEILLDSVLGAFKDKNVTDMQFLQLMVMFRNTIDIPQIRPQVLHKIVEGVYNSDRNYESICRKLLLAFTIKKYVSIPDKQNRLLELLNEIGEFESREKVLSDFFSVLTIENCIYISQNLKDFGLDPDQSFGLNNLEGILQPEDQFNLLLELAEKVALADQVEFKKLISLAFDIYRAEIEYLDYQVNNRYKFLAVILKFSPEVLIDYLQFFHEHDDLLDHTFEEVIKKINSDTVQLGWPVNNFREIFCFLFYKDFLARGVNQNALAYAIMYQQYKTHWKFTPITPSKQWLAGLEKLIYSINSKFPPKNPYTERSGIKPLTELVLKYDWNLFYTIISNKEIKNIHWRSIASPIRRQITQINNPTPDLLSQVKNISKIINSIKSDASILNEYILNSLIACAASCSAPLCINMLQEIKSDVKLKFANQIEFYECTYEWNDWEVNDALETLNTIEDFDTRFEQQLSLVSLIKLKKSIRDNYISVILDQCYPGIHTGQLIGLLDKLKDRHCQIQPLNIKSLLRKAVDKDDHKLCLKLYKYWPVETELNESILEDILKKLDVKSDLETAINLFIKVNPKMAFLSLACIKKIDKNEFSVLSKSVFDETENLLQSYSYSELLDEIKKMTQLSEENKNNMIEDLLGALINLEVKFDTNLIGLLDSNYIKIKYQIDLLKKYGIDISGVDFDKLVEQINDYSESNDISSKYLIAIGLVEIQNGRTEIGISRIKDALVFLCERTNMLLFDDYLFEMFEDLKELPETVEIEICEHLCKFLNMEFQSYKALYKDLILITSLFYSSFWTKHSILIEKINLSLEDNYYQNSGHILSRIGSHSHGIMGWLMKKVEETPEYPAQFFTHLFTKLDNRVCEEIADKIAYEIGGGNYKHKEILKPYLTHIRGISDQDKIVLDAVEHHCSKLGKTSFHYARALYYYRKDSDLFRYEIGKAFEIARNIEKVNYRNDHLVYIYALYAFNAETNQIVDSFKAISQIGLNNEYFDDIFPFFIRKVSQKADYTKHMFTSLTEIKNIVDEFNQ